jgi:hypothetical protein
MCLPYRNGNNTKIKWRLRATFVKSSGSLVAPNDATALKKAEKPRGNRPREHWPGYDPAIKGCPGGDRFGHDLPSWSIPPNDRLEFTPACSQSSKPLLFGSHTTRARAYGHSRRKPVRSGWDRYSSRFRPVGLRASRSSPPRETARAGPSTDVHVVGRNASNTEPARFVVVLLKGKGAPILTPVKE